MENSVGSLAPATLTRTKNINNLEKQQTLTRTKNINNPPPVHKTYAEQLCFIGDPNSTGDAEMNDNYSKYGTCVKIPEEYITYAKNLTDPVEETWVLDSHGEVPDYKNLVTIPENVRLIVNCAKIPSYVSVEYIRNVLSPSFSMKHQEFFTQTATPGNLYMNTLKCVFSGNFDGTNGTPELNKFPNIRFVSDDTSDVSLGLWKGPIDSKIFEDKDNIHENVKKAFSYKNNEFKLSREQFYPFNEKRYDIFSEIPNSVMFGDLQRLMSFISEKTRPDKIINVFLAACIDDLILPKKLSKPGMSDDLAWTYLTPEEQAEVIRPVMVNKSAPTTYDFVNVVQANGKTLYETDRKLSKTIKYIKPPTLFTRSPFYNNKNYYENAQTALGILIERGTELKYIDENALIDMFVFSENEYMGIDKLNNIESELNRHATYSKIKEYNYWWQLDKLIQAYGIKDQELLDIRRQPGGRFDAQQYLIKNDSFKQDVWDVGTLKPSSDVPLGTPDDTSPYTVAGGLVLSQLCYSCIIILVILVVAVCGIRYIYATCVELPKLRR
jgi:hypothetical protein